jgi:membrane fusion protein, copper/silver efflux system
VNRLVASLAIVLFSSCAAEPPAADHSGHDGAAAPLTPAADPHAAHRGGAYGEQPSGYAGVTITRDRQDLIGLRTAKVEQTELSGTVRATAIIQADETKEAHVHTRLMGWVQDLYVATEGQEVRRGDALYTLYSQELFAAQQEYLNARARTPELAQAARQRLRLWDVPEDELRRIEAQGPQKAVKFRSPRAGTVVEKNIAAGHYIDAGTMLYLIADLSTVWVLAEVYEFEVNRIDKRGLAAVSIQGVSGAHQAKVDYVYPTLNEATRTVRVRLVLDNKDGQLRPGSFATVELPTVPIVALSVPREAIVDTGTRQVVYVSHGEHFMPVTVKLGRRAGDRVEIQEGLSLGQDVVTSAQFLLDSESRMRGGGPAGHGAH